jgi:hypothetical protein
MYTEGYAAENVQSHEFLLPSVFPSVNALKKACGFELINSLL